jgi:hypothetical protein
MRKNRATIFLVSVFFILLVVFYLMLNKDKDRSIEEIKKDTLEMCQDDHYEDAFNYLNEQLVENESCSKGKPGREELEKMRDRIYTVQE